METDKSVEGEDYYIDDAVNPGEAGMEAAGMIRTGVDPAVEVDKDAEARRNLIQDMQDRARKNVGEHEVHSFPLDTEVGGIYIKSERGRPSKKSDKEPGMIHTLETEDRTKTRFWGFGILDFHLTENKIADGDYIVVTRREKSEKNMWQCDFGYAKKLGAGIIGGEIIVEGGEEIG